jgi:DNA polymerase V
MQNQITNTPSKSLKIPLFQSLVSAGFPSPAEDYEDLELNLEKYIVKNPSATFYVRVKGDSMQDARIYDGDILVVDKAETPRNGDVIVALLNGDFTVKRLVKKNNTFFLMPENPAYPPIEITEFCEFRVWGVVTYTLHKQKK